MATVCIAQNGDIGAAIEEVLQPISLDALVGDKIVAVKPNETWASQADATAVTQPDTLRAVLRVLKRFRPKQIIVTGGAGAAETEDVLRHSGMMEVIEDEAVEFFDHNRPPFKSIPLAYDNGREVRGPQKEVMVNPRVLEYETLVAVSQLKVHETATVTMALKNIAMSYPAADHYGHPRSKQKHSHSFFDDMHSFIAAMAKRFPIDLAITVGHPAMIGRGPIGGHTVETGLALASTDPVAADAVGAMLLGFEAQGVRHIWEAERLGVGESDVDNFEYPLLRLEEAYARFTEAAYGRALEFQHA